jgi:uncharacterized protein (DUF58 family)
MIRTEILKRIRQIELHTKRIMRGTLFGQSSSAVKGSGFEFDQIREYQPGDDVRFIDWKSSAKTGKIMTRQYIEERSRTTVIAVDISSSIFYGSDEQKYAVVREIAAVLALLSEYAKDRVGLMLFSNQVDLFIPPSRGQAHIQHIMHTLFEIEPKSDVTTSLDVAFDYLARLKLKQAMLFFVSDFIAPTHERSLGLVAKKFDTIAIRCLDPYEVELPSVGFIPVVDQETGQQAVLDARTGRSRVQTFLQARLAQQNSVFNKHGIDLFEVRSNRPYVQDMVSFFKKRMLY